MSDPLAEAREGMLMRLEARLPDDSNEWIPIYPAQLQWMAKEGNQVRAIEVSRSAVRSDDDLIDLTAVLDRSWPAPHWDMARAIIDAGYSRASAQAAGNCGVIEFEYCNWEGRKAIRQQE